MDLTPLAINSFPSYIPMLPGHTRIFYATPVFDIDQDTSTTVSGGDFCFLSAG
jgi:hypothetical protein